MGIPPTNTVVTVTGFSWSNIEDDKIVESWNNGDELGLMQQLGVIPSTKEDYSWESQKKNKTEPESALRSVWD